VRSPTCAARAGLARAQAGIEHAGGGAHGIHFQAQEHDVGELTLALAGASIGILALTPELATLEDLFFRLTEGNGAGRSQASASGGPGADALGAGASAPAPKQRAVEIG
jgi:hypothetical protein